MRLLSVDPSIVNIGVAILENGKPLSSYTLRTDDKCTIEHRLRVISDHFKGINGDFDCAIVEMPDPFIRYGSRGGASNLYPLQLLHLAIGAIVGALVQNHNIIVHLVPVSEWKGNTKKANTQYIIKAITGKILNTHEADAVHMGIKWSEIRKLRHALKK